MIWLIVSLLLGLLSPVASAPAPPGPHAAPVAALKSATSPAPAYAVPTCTPVIGSFPGDVHCAVPQK